MGNVSKQLLSVIHSWGGRTQNNIYTILIQPIMFLMCLLNVFGRDPVRAFNKIDFIKKIIKQNYLAKKVKIWGFIAKTKAVDVLRGLHTKHNACNKHRF